MGDPGNDFSDFPTAAWGHMQCAEAFHGTRWDFGEFSGDGAIDISDFNLWNGNKFSSSDAVNAVPEPSLGIWFLVVGVMLNLTQRTRRRA